MLLLLAGALALWLVRVGLRPLVHIADTADAVASATSIVGSTFAVATRSRGLGRALNSAFDARATSEHTLREFISDASHELRTPLTSIRGYAELLRAGALHGAEEGRHAAARIEHEAARMGVLVDNLLSLARLDEGRPLELADVDLTALAADAVNDARAVEPDRPITLVAPRPGLGRRRRNDVAAGAREPAGERPRSTRRRDTAVEVSVSADSTRRRIDVVDDGARHRTERARSGLRPLLARQGRPQTVQRWRSGLGLAIVAAVAAAHGGTARVEFTGGPTAGCALRRRTSGAALRPDGPSFTSGAQLGSRLAPGSTGLLG